MFNYRGGVKRVTSWPETVGLLLGEPLMLSSDVEALKLEGRQLENRHGIDKGNGWAYSHALGYFKKFQAVKLHEAGYTGNFTGKGYEDIFCGPSLRELADEEEVGDDQKE